MGMPASPWPRLAESESRGHTGDLTQRLQNPEQGFVRVALRVNVAPCRRELNGWAFAGRGPRACLGGADCHTQGVGVGWVAKADIRLGVEVAHLNQDARKRLTGLTGGPRLVAHVRGPEDPQECAVQRVPQGDQGALLSCRQPFEAELYGRGVQAQHRTVQMSGARLAVCQGRATQQARGQSKRLKTGPRIHALRVPDSDSPSPACCRFRRPHRCGRGERLNQAGLPLLELARIRPGCGHGVWHGRGRRRRVPADPRAWWRDRASSPRR